MNAEDRLLGLVLVLAQELVALILFRFLLFQILLFQILLFHFFKNPQRCPFPLLKLSFQKRETTRWLRSWKHVLRVSFEYCQVHKNGYRTVVKTGRISDVRVMGMYIHICVQDDARDGEREKMSRSSSVAEFQKELVRVLKKVWTDRAMSLIQVHARRLCRPVAFLGHSTILLHGLQPFQCV